MQPAAFKKTDTSLMHDVDTSHIGQKIIVMAKE
jgi:hypothetical protein